MLKYSTERSFPHDTSVVKTRHNTLQKQRGATRGPQRRAQHDKLSPRVRAPPASKEKKQQTDTTRQQNGKELGDDNVVSLSELRHILRLAEPMSVAGDASIKATASLGGGKRGDSETLEVKSRMFPTLQPTFEVSESDKNPVITQQQQGLSISQGIKKSPTTLSSDGIFFPFGSPGGGAPMRTNSGRVKADYREMVRGSSQQPHNAAVADTRKLQPLSVASQQLEIHRHDTYHTAATQQDVSPQQYGRALPHAMRSSIAFGTAYGSDEDTATRDKRQWLIDLQRQVEEARARKAAEKLRQRVIDERDALQDTRYQMWQPRAVPATPPAIQTVSPGKTVPDLSPNSGDEKSYHRQHKLLLDPSVLLEMDQKRQKDLEHHRFVQHQMEERQCLKRVREEQLAREAAIEEARVEKERAQLRLQYEKEQAAAKDKEEAARRRQQILEEQIAAAHAASLKERHSRVRRHVGHVSPLEIVAESESTRDVELPSSGKVLTLSASKHVFTDDTELDNVSCPFATVEDSAVDRGATDSRLSVSEVCEEPENVQLYTIDGRGATGVQNPVARKPNKKQQLTKKPERKANEPTQRHTIGTKVKQREVHRGPMILDNLKSMPDNNRYRQNQNAVESRHVMKGNKTEALRRRTVAPPKSTARKQPGVDHSSHLPVTRRKFEVGRLQVEDDLVYSHGKKHSRANARMRAVSSDIPALRKPPRLSDKTTDRQAGGRRKQQVERKTVHRSSKETFTVARCGGEVSFPCLPSTHYRLESVSPVATYVVDGSCEGDGSEAYSVPSTGDAYRVPVRRTSATLPSVVESARNAIVHKPAAQETDKYNVKARITSAGGTHSELLFHNELQDSVGLKQEQQTVRPHPLQLPSTTSQVLHETKLYLETCRHNQQQQFQSEQKMDTIQQKKGSETCRQKDILSQLAFLRQGLINKQKQLKSALRDCS